MTPTVSDASTEPLRLLVHGPGLPVQGALLSLEFGADSLRLEELDGSYSKVPYDALTTRPGGWSGESLMLEWEDPAGTRSVLLDDPLRFEQVIKALPNNMRQRMEGWRREVRHSRRVLHVGLILVITLTLLPLFAISILMLKAEDVVTRAMQRIPVSWEQQLGAQALKQMYLEEHVLHSGAAHALFSATADQLLQHVDAPYPGRIMLVEGPLRSALVLPGGTIVVWSGLLSEMRTPQELAGLLAHEIEHGVERHSMHAILRGRGMRAALGVYFFGPGMLDAATGEITADIGTLAYSRSQEIATDAASKELLAESGWQEGGLAKLLARLSRQSNEPHPIFAMHPQGWGPVEITKPAANSRGDVEVPPAWQAVLDDLQSRSSEQGSEQAP